MRWVTLLVARLDGDERSLVAHVVPSGDLPAALAVQVLARVAIFLRLGVVASILSLSQFTTQAK
jgi:hypothetical protein